MVFAIGMAVVRPSVCHECTCI